MVPKKYVKPNMTILSPELDMRIIKQIIISSAPAHKRLDKETDRLEKRMSKGIVKSNQC